MPRRCDRCGASGETALDMGVRRAMRPPDRCTMKPTNKCPRRGANRPGTGQHPVEVLTMAKRTCSVAGCENVGKVRRGWCMLHYRRWRSHGDPLWLPPTPEARFWSYVDKAGSGGCWLWTACKDGKGYARLSVDGRQVPAHRFAYELLTGPIPDGLQLDHLCRVRHCVNPEHLEPVTNRENLLRGIWHRSPWAKADDRV